MILSQLKISVRLFVMLLVPTLAAGWLAYSNIRTNQIAVEETIKIEHLALLGIKVSAVVHEMQKERGMSAGFIASGGVNFASDIIGIRTLLDERRSDLSKEIDYFRATTTDQVILERIDRALTAMEELSEKRAQVNRLALTVPQMAGYYTGTISALLDIVAALPTVTSDPDVSNATVAYLNFLEGKERAGLERAMGAAGFGAGTFNPTVYQRFVSLIGRQNTYFENFKLLGGPDATARLNDVLDGPEAKEVQRLRDIALASPTTGTTGNIKGTFWFQQITKKIDRLKEVEDLTANDLLNLTLQKEEIAKANLQSLYNSTLGILGLVAILALLVGRSITTPIKRMSNAIGGLARGAENVEIPNLRARDEIGDMARSLVQVREMGTKSARAQAALQNSPIAIMLLDRNGTVIYLNAALEKLVDTIRHSLSDHFPAFKSTNLLNQNFSTLHNCSELKAAALDSLSGNTNAKLQEGGVTIDLNASPAFNEDGDRLGTVVEWRDRTQMISTEQEIEMLVAAAANGDFGMRLNEDDKHGFILKLTQGMNRLATNVDRGLSENVRVMTAMANGDLSQRVEGDYEGTFQKLQHAANQMADRLSSITGQISDVSNTLFTTTQEIASSSDDLRGRTEQQATSLEQTAAAMEELSTTVKKNAESAQETRRLADDTQTIAQKGSEVTNNAVRAMQSIEAASSKINNIVSVIQDIAFQTNLLALNAAVEAARAGESGKGFAVVATEVRALAQKTAEASQEIGDLISNSDEQIRSGVELVNRTGESLADIVASIESMSGNIRLIAEASHEQAIGIDEVNQSVLQLDKVTQQNAAMAEESSAASMTARQEADRLKDAVGFFRGG